MFSPSIFKRIPLLAATLVAGFYSTASAQKTVYHVDGSFQGESPTGESWRSAFPNLTMALTNAAANGGGEIWVKSGVYKPAETSRDTAIVLTENIELYGGFRGNELQRDERRPKSNRTVLSGDIGRAGSHADNAYHVLVAADRCVIDGFIINRGNANSVAEHRFGGGLRVPAGVEGARVANSVFEKNNAEMGGAIHVDSAELSVSNCTFYSNSASEGGAIATRGEARLNIADSIFSSNYAPRRGGGVAIDEGAEAVLAGSSFLYNSTDGLGGGLSARVESANETLALRLETCVFTENSARENGGAIGFSGAFTPVVEGGTFEKNFSARGAGGVANEAGVTAVVIDAAFSRNRGAKGRENLGTDSRSRVVESRDEGERVAAEAQRAFDALKNPEPEVIEAPVEVERPKRAIPDVFVFNERDIKIKLRGAATSGKPAVFILADLTDPDFIDHYRALEALARDNAEFGARFTYVYRSLKHPENNAFPQPFHQKERARHARLAKEYLLTSIPWTYDLMDNQTAKALAPNGENSVFLFAGDGTEALATTFAETQALSDALVELVGEPLERTPLELIPESDFEAMNPIEAEHVTRVKAPLGEGAFVPLQITPLDSRSPHFVKLRVEGDPNLLKTGDGRFYLGFHIDPLYKVEWNNMGEPLKYAIKPPAGVVAPSINSAERVTSVARDAEPREFMLQARKLDLHQPLTLQVSYSVHAPSSKKNIEVQQQRYLIYLEEDAFAGQVFGRQIAERAKSAEEQQTASDNAFATMLRRFDLNRDGKLSRDEATGGLRARFNEMDANGDGVVTEAEFRAYRAARENR